MVFPHILHTGIYIVFACKALCLHVGNKEYDRHNNNGNRRHCGNPMPALVPPGNPLLVLGSNGSVLIWRQIRISCSYMPVE
jgi:hypothetical protein